MKWSYSDSKNIRLKTLMLRSDLCDYNDVYIVLKEKTSLRGSDNANIVNKKLTIKNNALFRSCILKINNTFIDNAEDQDIAMPKNNLLKYRDNCSMTSGILLQK